MDVMLLTVYSEHTIELVSELPLQEAKDEEDAALSDSIMIGIRSMSSRAFLSASPPAPSASNFFIRLIRTRNRMVSLSPPSHKSWMT